MTKSRRRAGGIGLKLQGALRALKIHGEKKEKKCILGGKGVPVKKSLKYLSDQGGGREKVK